ncbi:MAG: PQQ-binding-like beta-propeller repeat protein [Halobacteria archaeon]|nr:PQQ-binding-like beta-propeller repeat protein [Halobacteria archaeon]
MDTSFLDHSERRLSRRSLLSLLRTAVVSAALGVGSVGSSGLSSAQTSGSETETPGWKEFCKDSGNTSYTEAPAPDSDVSESWSFGAIGSLKSSPSVVGDTVYVGIDDSNFYALRTDDGVERWNYTTRGNSFTTPSVSDGRLYFGSNSRLHAVDAENGDFVWEYYVGVDGITPPTTLGNTVYFGGENGILYAVYTETGKNRWSFSVEGKVAGSPAATDTHVYVGDSEGNVYGLDSGSGEPVWSYYTGFGVTSSPTVDASNLYVANTGGEIYAFSEDGDRLWSFGTDSEYIHSLAVSGRDVYGVARDGKIYAVEAPDSEDEDTDPESRWVFDLDEELRSPPALTDDYLLVAGVESIYAFDRLKGEITWSYGDDLGATSTPVVTDGSVFVGDTDGNLRRLTGDVVFEIRAGSVDVSPTQPETSEEVRFEAEDIEATHAIAKYRWEFGDGETATGETVSHTYSSPGSYTVVLKAVDSGGRTASVNRSLNVVPSLTADFSFRPEDPEVGDEVVFEADDTAWNDTETDTDYSWSVSDNSTAQGSTFRRVFDEPGNYTVRLTVNASGVNDTAVRSVNVNITQPDGGVSDTRDASKTTNRTDSPNTSETGDSVPILGELPFETDSVPWRILGGGAGLLAAGAGGIALKRVIDRRRNDDETETDDAALLDEYEDTGDEADGDHQTDTFADFEGMGHDYSDFEKVRNVYSYEGGDLDEVRVQDGTEEDFLLKTFNVSAYDTHGDAFTDLVSEAVARWASVDRHPNVVEVFDFGEEPSPWIALEDMRVGDLRGQTPLVVEDASRTVLMAARGVEHAHDKGVVHGRLSPRSVLLSFRGDSPEIKVSDWDLSVFRVESNLNVFDRAYLAPEQTDDTVDTDERVDVYGLGAVGYEIFTGEPPSSVSDGDSEGDGFGSEIQAPSSVNPYVPDGIDEVLLKALSHDPDDRHVSVSEFIRELEEAEV